MNSFERYINYVAEDLIKKTDIDYDHEWIYYKSNQISFPFNTLRIIYTCPTSFEDILYDTYGVQENEIDIVWELYTEKLLELIKK